MGTWVTELLDLLFPQSCFGCNDLADTPICPNCETRQQPALLTNTTIPGIETAVGLYDYSGLIQQVLMQIKFERNTHLIPVGQQWISKAAAQADFDFSTIDFWMAVPIHPKRLKQRGFNQVERLFEPFVRTCRTTLTPLVQRIKNTPPLFALAQDMRIQTLQNAFAVNPEFQTRIHGKTIAVLDDILTTGATLSEIGNMLKTAGAGHIVALTFTAVRELKHGASNG